MRFYLVVCFVLSAFSLCAQKSFGYRAMGTNWLFIIKEDHITKNIADEAFAEVLRIEKIFSNYDEFSEVAKLNSTNNWLPVSPEMLEVIEFSEELRQHSSGAFDIRIGQSTMLWKEGIKQGKKPNEDKQRSIQPENLELMIDHTLVKTNKHTTLDFGGVAKGYAVDKVFEYFMEMGFDTILVDGGGDMRMGPSPDGKGWKIAQHFDELKILRMENIAIATSGPTFQYLTQDSLTYSHIIDPRSLQPISIDRGVTVKANSCIIADALATALSASTDVQKLKEYYDFEVNLKEESKWRVKEF